MRNKYISLGNQKIGKTYKPFIIAEMSANHHQSLEKAIALVDVAHQAGVSAIKLQTYTADTMTLNVNRDDFKILDQDSPWYGRHLYELYQAAHMPWEWHVPIFEHAKRLGLLCFSTPFDESAVDFLEDLNVAAYKIASFENIHLNLLKKIARTQKPMIISTGLTTLEDINLIVHTLRENNCENFILLKCVSSYPADPKNANLITIPHMAELFDVQVGWSDHTAGIGAAIAAVALGATVIEKHVCLSRAEGGVDASFSIEPHELKMLVEEAERAWLSLGKVSYQSNEIEKKSQQFKRSLYFVKSLKAGDMVTQDAIKCIRPGYGLAPKFYDDVINKRLSRDVEEGCPVSFDHFLVQ